MHVPLQPLRRGISLLRNIYLNKWTNSPFLAGAVSLVVETRQLVAFDSPAKTGDIQLESFERSLAGRDTDTSRG